MLYFMIAACLIVTMIFNIVSSCYVCYNVAVDSEAPKSTLTTVAGIVVLNALVPYVLGCATGLWYIG